MYSRKKFILQGGLAATAMLALKPFSAIARVTSPFTGFGGKNSKLLFLHTANLNFQSDSKAIRYIANIKNNNANAILLNAGHDTPQDETGPVAYDVSINGGNDLSAITGDYKILNKGAIRTGIISAKPGESDVVQKINRLSAYLKKEKNCTIVVCLSQLGYKNKNTPDDMMLAEKSTHLDIIIGGNAKNFCQHPMITLNSNNEEVIIHSAAGDTTGFGKIEIDFNDKGQKKHVSFINKLSNDTVPNQAMPAA